MPEVIINVGGRQFEVACQPGEEEYLQSAAAMLDAEAQVLSDNVGRIPENRMLLMAGLMLADKTASMEDRVAVVQARLDEREAELAAAMQAASNGVSDETLDAMATLAANAEALADRIEAD